METTRFGTLFGGVAATVLLIGSILTLARSPAFPRQTPDRPPPVVNSPVVPSDVDIPNGSTGVPIAFFDDYSWRAFIALVWPAKDGQRGEPDTTKTVDDGGPRVFETYKALMEVFHDDGSAPTGWNAFDPPAYNACGIQAGFKDLTLASFSKFSNLGLAGFGTLVGPLVAQNKSYVRYHTAFNRIAFQNIVVKQWYLRDHLPQLPASITFDNGALDIKAAWIDMTGVPHSERYYVRSAHVLDPVTGQCAIKQVGLLGLHIVQKTPSRPQWIWSSFEHVDNVPPAQPSAPGTFALNDGTATPMPNTPPYPMPRVLLPPTADPFNVIRVKPLHASTVQTNKDYHNALALNSVWRFYQLVVTQWPTTPNSPATPGDPPHTFPGLGSDQTSFANVALETFEQKLIGTSCMACHNFTMKPTDFVWTVMDHAHPAKPATPNLIMRSVAFRQLRDVLMKSREQK
jgi:hypothetical protein